FIQVADTSIRVEDDGGRRSAHLLDVLVLISRGDIALGSGSGRDHREPYHAFGGPFLLQALHVAALVMLARVRAALVVPLKYHVLAVIGGEFLRMAPAIGRRKVRRRGSDGWSLRDEPQRHHR